MNASHDARLLRAALFGNACFSVLCSSVLLVANGTLAPMLGVPRLALVVVALGLLPFAFGLFRNARRPAVHRGEAWLAVALDLAWVGASAALVVGELWPLTTAGTWAVIGIAEVVLACSILQTVGLRRRDRAIA